MSAEPSVWQRFERQTPKWFRDAKFGIFVHWGPYSVPAWAEPIAELGAIDDETWFRHNPYSEWYWNTIRLVGSGAQEHHRTVFGDAPYDAFIDQWSAEAFDADQWAAMFRGAGARYVVLTSKHHDGVALWDAPGTGLRNTFKRGPKRDVVAELANATRSAGLRFGAYYSGGLDWGISNSSPIATSADLWGQRPRDAAYASYAYHHVLDLVRRYQPDILWNDIEWPDAGKHADACGLAALFDEFYDAVPDGVVNDRWGVPHCDFRTSEYQARLENEVVGTAWERCRGVGLSFGYNRNEDESHFLAPVDVVKLLADIVSRGGNLLLNIGPKADGVIPRGQATVLARVGQWLDDWGEAIYGSRVFPEEFEQPASDSWIRWTVTGDKAWAIVAAEGETLLPVRPDWLVSESAQCAGRPIEATSTAAGIALRVPENDGFPVTISFELLPTRR